MKKNSFNLYNALLHQDIIKKSELEQALSISKKQFKPLLNVLLEQNFVKDPSKTITDLITDKVSVLGENIVINSFSRFQIGEK